VTGYGLENQVSIPGMGKNVSLHHHVSSSLSVHTSSYPKSTTGKNSYKLKMTTGHLHLYLGLIFLEVLPII
jgi:hypothetical protein